MKAISFLGIAAYSNTTYCWQGQSHTTCFFPAALAKFTSPQKLLICITPTVDKHENLKKLENELDDLDITWQTIHIPEGHNEQDLWKIFDVLTEAVEVEEKLIFDVTHSFRSLPILAFLAVAYLKSAKSVRVERVLYGAYEARNSENQSPVFDLTPFVTLLDWLTATERFNRTGDARDLADLLKKLRAQLGKQYQSDPQRSEDVGRLGNLAGALTDISHALRLIRPTHAMLKIAGLEERIQKAKPMLDQTPSARPFALLLDSVAQTYRPLAHEAPDNPDQARQVLTIERTMIHWYAEREQWVQAVSLAREWLLSWIMVHLDLNQLNNLDLREKIERVVGAEANEYRNADENNRTFASVFLKSVPQIDKVLSLWLSLTKVRNDIDHAGMRENPEEPKSLIANIQKLIQRLDDLEIYYPCDSSL
jgi:CRISPR-associated DxTHG motif protein